MLSKKNAILDTCARVYFFFFADAKLPCPPSKLEDRMRATVFKAWDKLNGGRLAQCANLLTKPPVLSPDYFLKKLRAVAANAPSLRRPANWWTKRNQAAFRANMTIPDERTVAATFNRYFNRRRRRRRSCHGHRSQSRGIASPSLINERLSALVNQRIERLDEIAPDAGVLMDSQGIIAKVVD